MSEKNMDAHGRWRNVTVAFRVSPEEGALIDSMVAMSGLTKQDYITKRLTDAEVTVVPNSMVHRALSRESQAIYRELVRIRDGSGISPELEARICMLVDVYASLGLDAAGVSEVTQQDAAVRSMARNATKEKPETGRTDQSAASSPNSKIVRHSARKGARYERR